MLDKDKIIIVVYVGCQTGEETFHAIEKVNQNIRPYFDDSVKLIFAPDIGNIGVRFECINPVLLDEEQFKSVDKQLEKLDELIKKGNDMYHE